MKGASEKTDWLGGELPDLSDYYTESVLTDTAISKIEQEEATPVFDPDVNRSADRYEDASIIAEGAMKSIYQVNDTFTARNVAMAVIKNDIAENQSECNRFVKEARIAANLQHPNIVPIHDIGINEDNHPFFTMKLIRGENLSTILRKLRYAEISYLEKYDLTALLTIFLKVCNAVSFAHSKGIIHLDLKPENIQVGDYGEVLVLDWGLAKQIKMSADNMYNNADMKSTVYKHLSNIYYARQTVNGVVKGTPGYMSPEQAIGDISAKDRRADIYSLGCILYSILTHERPTQGETFTEIVKETISGDILPPQKRVPYMIIPESLNAVTMKAMAVNPDDRYQSVKEIENEINAFIGGFATLAQEAGLFTQIGLMYKRHKVEFSFILGSIMVIIFAFGVFFNRLSEEKDKANTALENFKISQKALVDTEKRISKDRRREWQIVYNDHFNTDTLNDEWQVTAGTENNKSYKKVAVKTVISDSMLTIPKHDISLVYLNKPITGDSRLEADVMLNSVEDSQIICFLRSVYFKNNIRYSLLSGYNFTCSAVDNSCALSKQGKLIERAELPVILKPNRTYKLVAEKVEAFLKFSIDGYPVLKVKDDTHFSTSEMTGLGIAVKNSGFSLDKMNVYQLGSSIKVDLLNLGCFHADKGNYKKSEFFLNEVIESGTSRDRIAKAKAQLKRVDKLKKMNREVERFRKILRKKVKLWDDNFLLIADDQINLLLPPGGLKDISVLKSLNITGLLSLAENPVKDLKPIQGLPIKRLILRRTDIASVKDIKHMDLEQLDISHTPVSSIAPLAGMNLKKLDIRHTNLETLNPIVTLPLETIVLTPATLPKGWRNTLLRCHSLKVIATNESELGHSQTVEEFWSKYGKGEK